ncbi:MAG: PilZ domain-containing protein [Planctomycetota bacterium]|nr:MAG: PilZ domain-containing protein [Planctomycetota bacterium]
MPCDFSCLPGGFRPHRDRLLLEGPGIRAILVPGGRRSEPPSPSPLTPLPRPARERRQHPRVRAPELPLLLRRGDAAPHRIRDLSRSGVAFYSEEPIPVMTQVRFAIEFPTAEGDSAFAEGDGVVVRCERLAGALGHYEVAVFFGELPREAAQLIQSYVDGRLDRDVGR